MHRNRLATLVVAMAMIIAFATGTAFAQQSPEAGMQTCSIAINTSRSVQPLQQSGCTSIHVSFTKSVSDSVVECSGTEVSGVIFGNDTYNNTLSNCTFSGDAVLKSMRSAHNNIIGSGGNYTTDFLDNSSDLAIGFYLTFISKDAAGFPARQLYAAAMPYYFANLAPHVFNSQSLSIGDFIYFAKSHNYILPRFGYYAPVNGSGSITFALEAFSLSKNSKRSFNPYWLICPAWRHDILSYYKFNITKNTVYSPSFISPTMIENIQLPANKPVYWNFTIRNYSGANSFTLYMFDGPQWKFAYPYRIFNDERKGNLSFNAGMQEPGIHQYIAEIYNNSNGKYEQDNSTTTNYGVGVAFCTTGVPLIFSEYYPIAYKNLTELNLFSTSNNICNTGLLILGNNITVDCKGGTMDSRESTIAISNSSVIVSNTEIIAHGNGYTAILSTASNVTLRNVSIQDYNSYSLPDGVVMQSGTITHQFPKPPQHRRTSVMLFVALFAAIEAMLLGMGFLFRNRTKR